MRKRCISDEFEDYIGDSVIEMAAEIVSIAAMVLYFALILSGYGSFYRFSDTGFRRVAISVVVLVVVAKNARDVIWLLLRLLLMNLRCMEFSFRSVGLVLSTVRNFSGRAVGTGLSKVRNIGSGLDFRRFVDLLGHLLPRTLRIETWEPHKENLVADYLEVRRYRTPWAKRWLKFCLGVNVLLAFVDCIRVGLQSQLGKFIVSLLPPRLREWILGSGK